MTEESVVPLRRNPSKQMMARGHLSRYGKVKGSSTRLQKHNPNARRTLTPQKTDGVFMPPSQPEESSPRTVKTSRSKMNLPIGVSGGNSYMGHRYRSGLGQSYRKGVIQLEKEDDDDEGEVSGEGDDFEDLEEENDEETSSPPTQPDPHLSIGVHPVEPTPPKLSEETVISVSSFADMASALKGARDKSGFVGSDDLFSTAVNRSKNLGEMARMVQGWNTAKRGSDVHHGLGSSHRKGDEDPREFEKVFREYTNTRAISNPVVNSLYRLFKSDENALKSLSNSSSSSSLVSSHDQTAHRLHRKKVNALVATTADEMSDFSERKDFLPDKYSNFQKHGVIESISAYTLNKMWQHGLSDEEEENQEEAPDIHGQALRVQQQLAHRRN